MLDNYFEAEEAAKLWGISTRQVQRLCKDGRVEGAVKFGTTWAISKDTKKPTRTSKLKPGRKTVSSKGETSEQA